MCQVVGYVGQILGRIGIFATPISEHPPKGLFGIVLRISSVNVTKSVENGGFGHFTEEILSGKHFLCSAIYCRYNCDNIKIHIAKPKLTVAFSTWYLPIGHRNINPLYSNVPFLYPLKTSEKGTFSDVFSEYRNRILG